MPLSPATQILLLITLNWKLGNNNPTKNVACFPKMTSLQLKMALYPSAVPSFPSWFEYICDFHGKSVKGAWWLRDKTENTNVCILPGILVNKSYFLFWWGTPTDIDSLKKKDLSVVSHTLTLSPQPDEEAYLSAVGSKYVPPRCWESCCLGKIS